MNESTDTTLLRLDNVSRHFGGLVAVDQVSAELKKGELVGLIGPNGAGKTTLFNLITGFISPTEGRIYFQDREITNHKPHQIARLGIGRTFQNLRIFPTMTVFDNVSIGAIGNLGHSLLNTLKGFNNNAHDDAVSELTWRILERVHLIKEAGLLAANLSYGQRKYLEIARALALHPKLLILDEPAAGLNEAETEELGKFIAALPGGGYTVLLVEHDMSLVMSICKRIIVLASGKKIADDVPKAVSKDRTVLEAYLGTET
jgi:branched-chain amino acid transport system ATP-binding protein